MSNARPDGSKVEVLSAAACVLNMRYTTVRRRVRGPVKPPLKRARRISAPIGPPCADRSIEVSEMTAYGSSCPIAVRPGEGPFTERTGGRSAGAAGETLPTGSGSGAVGLHSRYFNSFTVENVKCRHRHSKANRVASIKPLHPSAPATQSSRRN